MAYGYCDCPVMHVISYPLCSIQISGTVHYDISCGVGDAYVGYHC